MLCRESRLLAQAKSCGVKVCMYITETKETVFFPNAEKTLHPVIWHDKVYTLSHMTEYLLL